jgi:hypothetical protein
MLGVDQVEQLRQIEARDRLLEALRPRLIAQPPVGSSSSAEMRR